MSACALGCTTRDGHPYPAPDGYQLCDRCSGRLRDTIREIVDRFGRITPDSALLPPRQEIGRRTVGYESTPPGSVHVMALRDARTVAVDPGDLRSAVEVLHWWATYVRRTRGITLPRTATVASEAATVLFHWDWITRELPPADLMVLARELAETLGQLRAITGDPAPAIVAHCRAEVDGVTCGQPLHLPRGGTALHCAHCHARYDGVALIRLYHAEVEGDS